jgi:uncharacterized OB-fold protein
MSRENHDDSARIEAVGTYLPTWGTGSRRVIGNDEDAVTLAVAAGLAAIEQSGRNVTDVVLVTRQLPLLEGGNASPLLAGLGLDPCTRVSEVVGGAPAVLDAVSNSRPGTLVVGVDADEPAAASAILLGRHGARITPTGRVNRSLPVVTRDSHGGASDYGDPRLIRERGLGESLRRLGGATPIAVAGLESRDLSTVAGPTAPTAPTVGAASVGFVLAALVERSTSGQPVTGAVLATEQATVVAVDIAIDPSAGAIRISRDEAEARPMPEGRLTPGSSVSISLPAYERAFEYKTRLEAARCSACGSLSFPRRHRCLDCGHEGPTSNVPLPREGEVYSLATIRVPVPGLIGPYTVVIAELGDTGVRTLVKLTGAAPGSVSIGDRGRLVFRLVAVRSGVPDYGYGFLPERKGENP